MYQALAIVDFSRPAMAVLSTISGSVPLFDVTYLLLASAVTLATSPLAR
jgi:hypothetical protein